MTTSENLLSATRAGGLENPAAAGTSTRTGDGGPRLLDLFCGAGGCSVGYARAGFDVVGIDSAVMPQYPFVFHQADANTWPLDGFDAYAASPPCQDHSSLSSLHSSHGTAWMLHHAINRLDTTGKPYVVENVASADLGGLYRLTLCGSMFGLGAMCRDGVWRQLRRHRQFVSNVMMLQPECQHAGQPVGVYGNGGGVDMTRGYKGTKLERFDAMGIDWMTHSQVAQAIPPAFTQFIGEQLIEALAVAA